MLPHYQKKMKALEYLRFMGIVFLCIAVVLTAQKAMESIKLILQIKYYGENMERLRQEKETYGWDYVEEQNTDLVAWITCDDVRISLPIVKTTSSSDEDFYLTHDYWKNENPLGCPFLTHNSNFETTENASVAGHSTYNYGFEGYDRDSLNIFGNFIKYLTYNRFYSYKITIETKTTSTVYKVFACIKFESNSSSKATSLYNTTSITSQSQFTNFCNTAKELSSLKFENNPPETVYGKKLLTLLTCAKTDLSKRILTIAIEQ